MANSLANSLGGTVAMGSTTQADDAMHSVCPPYRLQVFRPAVDTDFTFGIATTDTAITVTSARFIPDVARVTNDTDYISLTLVKGDLAAGAPTTIATTKTTQVTGGTAFVIDVPWEWVIVTAANANVVAKDQRIKLVMTQTGTGPAWGGLVEIYYTLTN